MATVSWSDHALQRMREQTRYIAGYPGRNVVLARQSTDGKWYVAGLNGKSEPVDFTVEIVGGKTVSGSGRNFSKRL